MQAYWYFYVVRCCDHSLHAGATTDLRAEKLPETDSRFLGSARRRAVDPNRSRRSARSRHVWENQGTGGSFH
jgi:hypothetical protein